MTTTDERPTKAGKKAEDKAKKQRKKVLEQELERLQRELVTMQDWVRATGTRVVVLFEGRDAAGKGGVIKRVLENLNARSARVVALPAPTTRERGQWYFQRYIEHLPAAGEIVLLDRSWYNRAGVERVMGFCTEEEYRRFLDQVPQVEQLLIDDGILLRKYWFSVSAEEQLRRFKSRAEDPTRRWKLSPMDVESINRWDDYSKAKDEMFAHCDTAESPWFTVEGDDKHKARVNMIAHLLSTVPYTEVEAQEVQIPERTATASAARPPREQFRTVPDHAETVAAG